MSRRLGSDNGPLQPKYTVKYGAGFLIFFLSGLTLRTEQLKGAMANYKLNIFTQAFSMIVIPLVTQALFFPMLTLVRLNKTLAQGIVVVACMPPPVSTAVIVTKVCMMGPLPERFPSNRAT